MSEFPRYKAADQAVEQWAIGRLIPYAGNPRKNDMAVDRLAAAIQEFGFRVPILAKSDGSIIDGHLRLKAAQKLAMETVPVLLADDMTDVQIKAFRLSVNKMAELAGWDNDLLRVELSELGELGFDLDLTGFSMGEISGILLEREEGETDAAAEWKGMPEFDDQGCFRKIWVSFDTPEDVREFFSIIGQSHTDKTKSIWFPEKERRDNESMRWASDE